MINPSMTFLKRVQYITVAGGLILGLYKIIQMATPLVHAERHVLLLPGEEQIPFVPLMFPIYLSIYLFLPALIFIVESRRQVFRIIKVFTVTAFVHFLFFMFLPVEYVLRPALADAPNDPLLTGIKMMYAVDAPFNNFPSMHVSFAFLGYFCIRRYRPSAATAFLAQALLVALSTILVKQHYVADVLSAMLLAWVVNQIFLLRRNQVPNSLT